MYLKEMTSMLLEKFAGRVPDTEAELKQLKGATSLQQSRKGMCLRPDDTNALIT